MTIHYTPGNIFDSPAQVLVNTVNTVGAMGKGLALQFRNRYGAQYFNEYRQHLRTGRCAIGRPSLSKLPCLGGKWVMNFPTKQDWHNLSQLDWIAYGLRYIAANYQVAGITSIAVPALGCGEGGLELEAVREQIVGILGDLPGLEVYCMFSAPPAPALDPERL